MAESYTIEGLEEEYLRLLVRFSVKYNLSKLVIANAGSTPLSRALDMLLMRLLPFEREKSKAYFQVLSSRSIQRE